MSNNFVVMKPQAKLEKESSEKILYFQDKLAKKTEIGSARGYHEDASSSDMDLELYERRGAGQNFASEFDRGEVSYNDVYDLLQNIFICLQRDIEVKKEIVEELKSIHVSKAEAPVIKTRSSKDTGSSDKPNRIIGLLIFMNIVFALISAYYFFDMASLIQPMGIFNQLRMFFN